MSKTLNDLMMNANVEDDCAHSTATRGQVADMPQQYFQDGEAWLAGDYFGAALEEIPMAAMLRVGGEQ